MSQHSPDSSVYHVSILGDNSKVIQEGSLEATPTSLIYTEDTSLTKYSWPLKHLRKFEIRGENVFVIEGGKLCVSGKGVYTFSTPHARQLYSVVSRNANLLAQTQTPSHQNETSPVHWRLNTSVSSASDSSTNHSPVHSRSSSLIRENTYEVERLLNDIKAIEHGTLEVGNGVIIYTDSAMRQSLQWPKEYLRRHGHENDILIIETGRRCLGGAGLYNFRTPRAAEINAAIRSLSSSGGGSTSSGGDGMSPSPTETKTHTPQAFATPSPQGATPPVFPQARRLPPLPTSITTKEPTPPPLPPPARPSLTKQRYSPAPIHTSFSPSHNTHHASSTSPPPDLRTPQKKSDSLMRRAFSAMDLRKDVYEVRNLSDDRKEVGQGTLEVTATDLIYIDSRTNEKWKWPFKFLRKYGYEKNVFSFEAGRRCAGGQGLYAFSTDRAREINEAIVENIRGSSNSKKPPQNPTSKNTGSKSRFSLTDDRLAATPPPPTTLTNVNQYNIDKSRNGSQTPPTLTTPTRGAVRPRSHRAVSSPHVHEQPNPDYTLTSTHPKASASPAKRPIHVSTSFSHTPSPPPPPLPQCRLVKPVLEPSKTPQREHLYDVPQNYGQDSGGDRKLDGSQRSIPSPPTPEGNTSGRNSPKIDTDTRNGVERKASTSPDNPPPPAVSEGRGKHGSKKKEKNVNVLSWLKKRSLVGSTTENGVTAPKSRSKKRKGKKSSQGKREKSAKENLNGEVPGDDDGGGQADSMYENLQVAKLRKMSYSASCDNILESCTREYVPSTDSVVPQPSQTHSMSPPVNTGRPRSADLTESEQTASFYQNLDDLRLANNSRGSNKKKATPHAQDTPNDQATPSSAEDSLAQSGNGSIPALYSNIQLASRPDETPILTETPHKPTSYADFEILPIPPSEKTQAPRLHGKLGKESSLTALILEAQRNRESSWEEPNRQRSLTNSESNKGTPPPSSVILPSGTPVHEPVQYAAVDFQATKALAQIRQEHSHVRNFEGLLERHDVREVEAKRRRGKVSSSRDLSPPISP